MQRLLTWCFAQELAQATPTAFWGRQRLLSRLPGFFLSLGPFLISSSEPPLPASPPLAPCAGGRRPLVSAVKYDLPAHVIPPHEQPAPRVATVLRALSCTHSSQPHTILNYLIDAVGLSRWL